MPQFIVTGPDGTEYEVDGPEGATEQEALAQVQAQHAAPDTHQMATAPAPVTDRHTGFQQQARQAIPDTGTSVPIPTEQEFQQGATDYGLGRLKGLPATAAGFPGDIMGLLSALPKLSDLSRPNATMPRFPNSTEMGNMMFGEPKSNLEAFGRATTVEGPTIASGILKGVGKGLGIAGRAAGKLAPAMAEGAKSGFVGGIQADSFLANLRTGGAKAKESVLMAKDGLSKMFAERGAAYRKEMAALGQNAAPLPFDAIDDALSDAASVGTYKGKVISKGATGALGEIKTAVDDWKASGLNTAEDLDKLKQLVGNIAKDNAIQPHTPGAVVVDKVYGAIKDTIVKHDDNYARVMKDYMDASDELREVEKSLSLGRKVTADTSLRKLMSIFRNNANTNYGARVESGQRLAGYDERLMPSLAGQELSSIMPRGIMGQVLGAGGIGASMLNPAHIPAALGALAVSSPRVLGEAAFAAGRVGRAGSSLLSPLKNLTIPGGGAGIPGIDARLLAQLSPQMLNQLLLSTRTPPQ